MKNGASPALVHADGRSMEVPVPRNVEAVDARAAGDAFNAACIAARLRKEPPEDAALAGHRPAARFGCGRIAPGCCSTSAASR